MKSIMKKSAVPVGVVGIILLLIVPVAFALNWLVYSFLLTPLVRRTRTRAALEVDSILATFGLLFIVQGVMQVTFGGNYYSYSYLNEPVRILDSVLALNRLLALGFAAVFGIGFYLALTRTRLGTAIRAVAVDPVAARLVAIDVRWASALAFAAGDRKSTRLNSSHLAVSRMPSSA